MSPAPPVHGAGAPVTLPLPPLRWLFAMAAALLRRPGLVPVAFRQLLRLAPRGWWRRSPHLPLPPAAYVRFRSQTMYGDSDRLPEPADVCTYLAWCRDFPRAHR
jgi:hypothetical protein